MQFKSTRKVTLSNLGHVVTFDKDETNFLPPALHQQAIDEGLEPVDETGGENPTPTPSSSNSQEETERLEKILEAMRQIAERNNLDDFTAGGVPKFKAIETLAGVKPKDADECAKLWAEVSAGVGV